MEENTEVDKYSIELLESKNRGAPSIDQKKIRYCNKEKNKLEINERKRAWIWFVLSIIGSVLLGLIAEGQELEISYNLYGFPLGLVIGSIISMACVVMILKKRYKDIGDAISIYWLGINISFFVLIGFLIGSDYGIGYLIVITICVCSGIYIIYKRKKVLKVFEVIIYWFGFNLAFVALNIILYDIYELYLFFLIEDAADLVISSIIPFAISGIILLIIGRKKIKYRIIQLLWVILNITILLILYYIFSIHVFGIALFIILLISLILQIKMNKAYASNKKTNRILIILNILFIIILLASGGVYLNKVYQRKKTWSKTFGGFNDDIPCSVIQTADGGYLTAGETKSYEADSTDMWIFKIDEKGNSEWSKIFGGSGDERALSMDITADGGYIVAGYTSSYGSGGYDYWLLKLDERCNEEWNRTFGGNEKDLARSVLQTCDGGYIVAGNTRSYGNGGSDGYIVKTDIQGYEEWCQTYGGDEDDFVRSLVKTKDGGYIAAGSTESYDADSTNFWLFKLDSNGDLEWNRTFGGSSEDIARSVVQTPDGGYAVAGWSNSFVSGDDDFLLVKTDSEGVEEWSKTFGGSGNERSFSLVLTDDKGFLIAGCTSSIGSGSWDFWIVKLNMEGIEEWNRTFGGSSFDAALSVIQTVDGGYVVTGISSGADNLDMLIIRTDSEGKIYER